MPYTPQLWHLPFIQPAKGCLYCLDGTPAAADPERWLPSTALLQPEPGAPGSDLRLIHANVEEARVDCKSWALGLDCDFACCFGHFLNPVRASSRVWCGASMLAEASLRFVLARACCSRGQVAGAHVSSAPSPLACTLTRSSLSRSPITPGPRSPLFCGGPFLGGAGS